VCAPQRGTRSSGCVAARARWHEALHVTGSVPQWLGRGLIDPFCRDDRHRRAIVVQPAPIPDHASCTTRGHTRAATDDPDRRAAFGRAGTVETGAPALVRMRTRVAGATYEVYAATPVRAAGRRAGLGRRTAEQQPGGARTGACREEALRALEDVSGQLELGGGAASGTLLLALRSGCWAVGNWRKRRAGPAPPRASRLDRFRDKKPQRRGAEAL